MEKNDFIASLLLTKASVDFQDTADAFESVEDLLVPPQPVRSHYQRLKQKALFCKAPKNQKALLAAGLDGQVA